MKKNSITKKQSITMASQRKGARKIATKKSKTKRACSVRKPKQQQKALRKVNCLLAEAVAAESNALRVKRTPRARQKVKQTNQEGKGLFSVLIPLIATAIGSAVAAR